jgi:hypothetical protein
MHFETVGLDGFCWHKFWQKNLANFRHCCQMKCNDYQLSKFKSWQLSDTVAATAGHQSLTWETENHTCPGLFCRIATTDKTAEEVKCKWGARATGSHTHSLRAHQQPAAGRKSWQQLSFWSRVTLRLTDIFAGSYTGRKCWPNSSAREGRDSDTVTQQEKKEGRDSRQEKEGTGTQWLQVLLNILWVLIQSRFDQRTQHQLIYKLWEWDHNSFPSILPISSRSCSVTWRFWGPLGGLWAKSASRSQGPDGSPSRAVTFWKSLNRKTRTAAV